MDRERSFKRIRCGIKDSRMKRAEARIQLLLNNLQRSNQDLEGYNNKRWKAVDQDSILQMNQVLGTVIRRQAKGGSNSLMKLFTLLLYKVQNLSSKTHSLSVSGTSLNLVSASFCRKSCWCRQYTTYHGWSLFVMAFSFADLIFHRVFILCIVSLRVNWNENQLLKTKLCFNVTSNCIYSTVVAFRPQKRTTC